MSIAYGRVRCTIFGEPATLELAPDGWRGHPDAGLLTAFNLLADPADFGPADGDPMAAAVVKLAGILSGTYELTDLPSPPPGTVY